MAESGLQALTCPACGNVNPYAADVCMKCGLALAPIRAILEQAGQAPPSEGPSRPSPQTAKPAEPAPPLPDLARREDAQDVGNFVDSHRFLVRGIGDRAEEIAARFFGQLASRGIEGLKLGRGKLVVNLDGGRSDSRDHYFAERDLGDEALATMAIRITPIGTDLFVEWRHYAMGSIRKTMNWAIVWVVWLVIVVIAVVSHVGGLGVAPSWGLVIVGFFLGLIFAEGRGRERKWSLEGFQTQDSQAFQLAVRDSIRAALRDAAVDESWIQDVPKGGEPGPRLI